jgi:heme/copper-type cytochrome/quinol oxidase subunit 3
MERKWTFFIRILIIILAILACILFYSVQSQSEYAPSKPVVTTDAELLITVILCVSLSLWVTLTERKVKEWQRILFLAGLACAGMFSFYYYLAVGVDLASSSPGWQQANPTAVQNLNVTTWCLFIMTVILASSAILVFILILWPANKVESLRRIGRDWIDWANGKN